MCALETKLFYFINRTCANPLFDRIMVFLSALGGGEAIFVIAVLILIFAKGRNKNAGILLAAAVTIAYYAVFFSKGWVARPRPFVSLSDVRLLIGASGFSFPSGHATQAFMAAAVLSNFFKKRALFFSIAGLAAFSRVYVGVHFVSDVVCGALLGTVIGYALIAVYRLSGERRQ